MTPTEHVLINGTPYDVLCEHGDFLCVRRPTGSRDSVARRLPDSPFYGENRARLEITRSVVEFHPREIPA